MHHATATIHQRSPGDSDWDHKERGENTTKRLDRNWNDMLQELRVAQTGVQVLTGLLLTVPFQSRFDTLNQRQRIIYLVTFTLTVASTGLLVAPVMLHRMVFGHHGRGQMVAGGQLFMLGGLMFLGLAVVGVAFLIYDVVLGLGGGLGAAGGVALYLGVLWAVIPIFVRFCCLGRNKKAHSPPHRPVNPHPGPYAGTYATP